MNLKYFSREAYTALKKALDINKDKYYSDEEWLSQFFAEQGIEEYCKESSIIVPDIELAYSGEDDDSKNKDDFNNIVELYANFKDRITPGIAADPLMWSALCHTDYKDYVLKRWKKGDGTVRLDQRFFATEGRTSLLYYNAISRLWWSGYLTYDELNEDDPWHLTRVLLSAQQIQKDLFDQPYSMNKNIVKGLLMALARIQKEKGNACTTLFRKCCDSYINHYGAVTIIDFLDVKEIEEIAYTYMKNVEANGDRRTPENSKGRLRRKGKKKKRK